MSEHSQHYEEVSDHYDSSIFYAEGPYVDWQRAECARHLALGADDAPFAGALVDVGGGSGAFACSLAHGARARDASVTVVERARLACRRG